jgi:hypothetical protein
MTILSVRQKRDSLDALLARASKLPPGDPLQADLARYLCVRVAGFLEKATESIYFEYARARAQPEVARFVGARLEDSPLPKSENLCLLAGSFDKRWEDNLRVFLDPEVKGAINSIIGQSQ